MNDDKSGQILFRPWDSKQSIQQQLESMSEKGFDMKQLFAANQKIPDSKMMIPKSTASMINPSTSQLFSSLFGSYPGAFPGAQRSKMPVMPPVSSATYRPPFADYPMNRGLGFLSMPPAANLFTNLFAYNLSSMSNSLLNTPNCLENLAQQIQQKGDSSTQPSAQVSSFDKMSDSDKLNSQQQKKQRPKRFQCPHCQVSFSNNGQLKGHIRIHTGERPYICDHPNCGKTFTRNEELTRHKRIHTGLRPFACSVCNKRFGRKDHLKKHVKTHQRPPPIPMTLPLDASLSFSALAYPWL